MNNSVSNGGIVRHMTMLLSGKQGDGKTAFAMTLASLYPIIYSNFPIYLNGKMVTNLIRTVSDLKKIKRQDEHAVIIIDEISQNAISRKSASDINIFYTTLSTLGRKIDADLIVIAQLERMADVYFRELAKFRYKMRSWEVKGGSLMFQYTVTDENGYETGTVEVDLFEFMRQTGFTYDSMDKSKIDNELNDSGRGVEKSIRQKKSALEGLLLT